MTLSILKKTSLMVAAGATLGALSMALSEPAHALGFADSYAPANFSLTNTNADGFVDTSGAPGSISIAGGDNSTGLSGITRFLTTAAGTGLVSFDWGYSTQDPPAVYDPFGYSLNGTFFQLTDSTLEGQSGSASFNVVLGDIFGFEVQTDDNVFGRGSATISNFSAPTAIPTPALLPGLIGLGVAALRKRKAEAVEQASEV